ncbi:hypothetical protein Vadar_001672 [Vaccinium darrowii]|uniref:Uncharacterized protein n=1 Tax=Vaccinium darrowii TaxID=229202 RepID=A0ACB7Y4A2_9ERIC|nr:hypothetical protein Vadar_001672 [Vaccinium darrowii]
MEILSQLWSLLGLLTVLQNILPSQILSLLHSTYDSLQDFLSPYSYFEIPEFNGYCNVDLNHLYRHVNLYLNSLHPSSSSSSSCNRLTLSRSKSSNRISFTVAPNTTVHDHSFSPSHRISWTHHVDTVQDSIDEKRSFTLKLPKRHCLALLQPYLDHVTSRAEEFERVSRERRLFTNNNHGAFESGWSSVPFRHPSTFETLALESELKKSLTEDLKSFSQDIDCSLDLTGDRLLKNPAKLTAHREKGRKIAVDCEGDSGGRVTLSGLLNFTDGLWSCCGEERIIVFTTNYRDSVDPALVRCGRMDVHVGLGTCGPHAFRSLVRNYLGVEAHEMFDVAESCIRAGGALTPAQIGEILLRNRGDADVAIRAVVSAMQGKILGGGGDVEAAEYEDMAVRTPESGDRKLSLSPGKWDASSPERCGGGGKKRREREGSTWDRKVKFLVRLKSLTKSDSGRRGV